ncbi:MAG: PQQ-dependent sugar dehydrogenase [Syntrophothermus sp.]
MIRSKATDVGLGRAATATRRSLRAAALAAVVTLALLAPSTAGAAVTLPSGFHDETVFSGLTKPTVVRFAPDGRVFVAQLGGKIWVYDSLSDTEPELFADLSKPVYDFADHGLLGLALDPRFDQGRPYVYALYTFNHELEDPGTQTPLVSDPKAETPRWSSKGPGYENDRCPEGEEAENEEIAQEKLGCEVSGLLVRLTASGGHAVPTAAEPEEDVLLEGWCQQSTTHSIGDVGFGPEGNLFVTGGEGAMYSEPDYGQFGNPCEDPPQPGSAELTRPGAEGGSLRAQSFLRPHFLGNRPTLLSGAVLRVDPDTGEGVAGNPYITSTEANARRIIAFGFRQPWRFAVNDATGNLFVSNVGNGAYEEIDRVPIGASRPYNSGWPCYEGPVRNLEYAGTPEPSLNTCILEYEQEARGEQSTTFPFYSYAHDGPAVPGDLCQKNFTDVAGSAFYEGSDYPPEYHGALFFADAIRGCIYVMRSLPGGEPDPATATTFLAQSEPFRFPGVDLETGPEGNLFYVQLNGTGGGSVHRIVYRGEPEEEPAVRRRPQLVQRPARKTSRRTARFVFKGEAGLRFRCRLDGKPYASCRSPRVYRHLAPGKHAFRVQGLDANRSPVTKVTLFEWRIVRK